MSPYLSKHDRGRGAWTADLGPVVPPPPRPPVGPCRWQDPTCTGDVRRYLIGPACDSHAPWALAGRPAPWTLVDPRMTAEAIRNPKGVPVKADRRFPVPTTVGTPMLDKALTRSIAARDAAMEQVDQWTPEHWRNEARKAIWHLATTRTTFTTDDVWETLEARGVTTREPRALGPVIMRALRTGAISNTGRREPSRRRHATRIDVYERGATS